MRCHHLIVPLVLVALAGCSAKPDSQPASSPSSETTGPTLAIADASVQLPAVTGRPAVAYFTLMVGDTAKGRLVAVSVDHFARGDMHQSKMAGTTMTMEPVDSVALVPGKPIVFAPGSYHVMLFDSDGTLKPGGKTTLTLTLDDGEKLTAPARVTAPGGDDMGSMKM